MTEQALALTHMSLARNNSERKSNDWIRAQLANDASRFIPIWQGDYFFIAHEALTLSACELNFSLKQLMKICYFLGCETLHDSPVFICDLSQQFTDIDSATKFLRQHCLPNPITVEYHNFRHFVARLDKYLAANLAYGRALSLWHQSALFCGCCGHATQSVEAGHSRQCLDEKCQKPVFPRTDPAVIMLVELVKPNQPKKCLLAAHHRLPENLVSTLAGFVDPGESLEQAVKREVFEEAGIEVEQVEYIASQPWPFPHSIMIGFIAKAVTDTITIDPNELTDARWYTAQEVEQFSEWGEDNTNTQMPRKESIARHLIDLWLARN
ncbi:NAD(+) diphosphatase [Thalassotalea sp. G2M2-11]|uniref:NAD(+) diphosphatase n=1 Tax=Thalassotalea sp. G2M2-11 TaxID=2787627 RepID=UPI0019D0FC31|nr:NAD(+) diphosphatase [Thalassotalea sp. G2M2-11]